MNNDKNHYDEDYFNWQKAIGSWGAKAELFKFETDIATDDVVLDFGCGGGYILNALNCKEKFGVEINPAARAVAKENGINVFENICEVENNSIDKLISNHALEHVFRPLDTLIELKEKLKPEGKAIFVVPHDSMNLDYEKDDINMHLYTWNPMTLGNLFQQAGYKVENIIRIQHQWIPDYMKFVEKHGWEKFDKECKKLAKKTHNYQIKIIAKNAE